MISDPQIGISMLILFIFVIMLGFPIAFTLMAIGVSFGFYAYYVPGQEIFANRVFTLLVQKTFEVASNDVLIAVPVFTFMGYIIDRANNLDRGRHHGRVRAVGHCIRDRWRGCGLDGAARAAGHAARRL
jgi:TRAP-type mannitol/chloroaromatic compound transport system permease large subunit